MKYDIKKVCTDFLATSECNLLLSIKDIEVDDIYRQVLPEVNHIGWIIGHCAVHLDWVFNFITGETRILSEEASHYYRFGTTKSEILSKGPPISFGDLVDSYLIVSKSFFKFLTKMKEDTLYKDSPGEPGEDLLHNIIRVSLHFMGHSGQIVLIRRALGNPGHSFVSGVMSESRERLMAGWHDWWNKNREMFRTSIQNELRTVHH